MTFSALPAAILLPYFELSALALWSVPSHHNLPVVSTVHSAHEYMFLLSSYPHICEFWPQNYLTQLFLVGGPEGDIAFLGNFYLPSRSQCLHTIVHHRTWGPALSFSARAFAVIIGISYPLPEAPIDMSFSSSSVAARSSYDPYLPSSFPCQAHPQSRAVMVSSISFRRLHKAPVYSAIGCSPFPTLSP